MSPQTIPKGLKFKEEDLPVDISEDSLSELIQHADELYPEDRFPDFSIVFKPRNNGKVTILGFGTDSDLARQTKKIINKHPDLRTSDWEIKVIRTESDLLIY